LPLPPAQLNAPKKISLASQHSVKNSSDASSTRSILTTTLILSQSPTDPLGDTNSHAITIPMTKRMDQQRKSEVVSFLQKVGFTARFVKTTRPHHVPPLSSL